MSDSPIAAALTAIVDRLDRLEDGQTRLRVDLMARMDRLQNQIAQIQDDITVNMARADRAHEAVDQSRGDVRGLSTELAVLWRQVKRQEAEIRELRDGKP